MVAWGIFAVFAVFAGLMYSRRLPAILALPSMAVLIAVIGSHGHVVNAVTDVFSKGPTLLAKAMTNTIFGAALAYVVDKCGIAESIVRIVTKSAGRRPVPVALLMLAATALAFVALGGLGAVIMVGTLVLPIMFAAGIRPLTASGVFLLGISIGGLFNVGGWGLYRDVFRAPVHAILIFSVVSAVALTVAAVAYILVSTRKRSDVHDEIALSDGDAERSRVPGLALATPLLPVCLLLLITAVDWRLKTDYAAASINAVLAVSALYGILTTRPRETVVVLSKAFTEGVAAIAPVLGLMVGIGMVVTSLMADPVTSAIKPALSAVLPHSIVGYVAFFAILSPLALYRGPFNLYGLGGGIAAILSTAYSPTLAMGALMATGLVQGVCDPTNTMNVWVSGFAKVDVNDILKSTLPYTMAATALALALMAGLRI